MCCHCVAPATVSASRRRWHWRIGKLVRSWQALAGGSSSLDRSAATTASSSTPSHRTRRHRCFLLRMTSMPTRSSAYRSSCTSARRRRSQSAASASARSSTTRSWRFSLDANIASTASALSLKVAAKESTMVLLFRMWEGKGLTPPYLGHSGTFCL